MKLNIKKGRTSFIDYIFIQDARSSSCAGLTGLVFNTASLTAYYVLQGAASAAISLVTQTVTGAFSSGGFKEVDSTNMPGVYRIDYPNAVLAAGSDNAVVYLQGAANMVPLIIQIALVDYDPQDGVHLGLTALPNTAVTTNGSLITSGNGSSQLSTTFGYALSNVGAINNILSTNVTTINANIGTTQALSFTVPGQVDANIQYVNDTLVNGNGSSGTPWGP